MTAPASTSARLRDVVTPYRVACTIALTAALLLMIFGFQRSREVKASCGTAPIVALLPCPGDSSLHQGLIGASLLSGYQAALSVDGVEIPSDEVRHGGPSQVYFQPGPGTATGALSPGRHTATIVYWPQDGDRDHGMTYTWTFTAT